MAKGLRFQSGLPVHFWGECLLTATFIINKLPTHESSWVIIWSTSIIWQLKNFWLFGLCLSTFHRQICSKSCERNFSRIPIGQKEYKFFDLITKKTFVTKHVKFHESVFPFLVQSSKSLLLVILKLYYPGLTLERLVQFMFPPHQHLLYLQNLHQFMIHIHLVHLLFYCLIIF